MNDYGSGAGLTASSFDATAGDLMTAADERPRHQEPEAPRAAAMNKHRAFQKTSVRVLRSEGGACYVDSRRWSEGL